MINWWMGGQRAYKMSTKMILVGEVSGEPKKFNLKGNE